MFSDLNLQSIVPFTQLRYKTSWVQKIFNQYKKISSDVQVDGKLVKQERMQYNFLLICWNLTVYGSAFFDATQVGKVFEDILGKEDATRFRLLYLFLCSM